MTTVFRTVELIHLCSDHLLLLTIVTTILLCLVLQILILLDLKSQLNRSLVTAVLRVTHVLCLSQKY